MKVSMVQRAMAITLALFSLSLLLGACSSPEDKIVDHVQNIGEIMEDNMDTPKDGVIALRHYMQNNLPEILEQVGEIIVELDKIEDKDERGERFKEIMKTIEEGTSSLEETGQKFAVAVMTDPEAMKYLEEWGKSWEALEGALSALKHAM